MFTSSVHPHTNQLHYLCCIQENSGQYGTPSDKTSLFDQASLKTKGCPRPYLSSWMYITDLRLSDRTGSQMKGILMMEVSLNYWARQYISSMEFMPLNNDGYFDKIDICVIWSLRTLRTQPRGSPTSLSLQLTQCNFIDCWRISLRSCMMWGNLHNCTCLNCTYSWWISRVLLRMLDHNLCDCILRLIPALWWVSFFPWVPTAANTNSAKHP